MVIKAKVQKSLLLLALLAVTGWAAAPFEVRAETAGSYAHPEVSGPDESNAADSGLKNVVPPGAHEDGAAVGAPEVKGEGSTRKGYGPGAHPPHAGYGHGKSEGSGKGYKHGAKGYSGGHPHHAKKHPGDGSGKGHKGDYSHHAKKQCDEGSGKGYKKPCSGHSKQYGHGGSHGYSGHRSGYDDKGHKHNPFSHILKFREKLGLTPGQVKEIMRLRFDWEKQRIRLGADLMIAHMELDRLVHSGVLNEPKMYEMAKLIGGLKMQKVQIMVEAKIALLKILTDEQRQKIADIHGNR